MTKTSEQGGWNQSLAKQHEVCTSDTYSGNYPSGEAEQYELKIKEGSIRSDIGRFTSADTAVRSNSQQRIGVSKQEQAILRSAVPVWASEQGFQGAPVECD